jgi:FeS assembly SUF system protein
MSNSQDKDMVAVSAPQTGAAAGDAVSNASESKKGLEMQAGSVSAIPQPELERMTDDIVAAIKTVFDPEINADIYELGLIYRVDVEDDRSVKIEMTLTTPACPSAAELPASVENAVSAVAGVSGVEVKLVWDPPWDPSRMSDEARAVLDMW